MLDLCLAVTVVKSYDVLKAASLVNAKNGEVAQLGVIKKNKKQVFCLMFWVKQDNHKPFMK